MDQAVHTGNDLSKGAELGERYDLGLNNRTNFVVLLEDLPRIVLNLFVTQRNLLFLGIDVLDINLYFVANADNLRGMLDLAPGQLGDVDHAVNAAQINKGTVIGQALHLAVVYLANLNALPELVLQGLLLILENGTDGADSSSSLTVVFQDLEANGLLEQILKIIVSGTSSLRSGNEYLHAIGENQNTAANHFGYNAFQNLAALAGFSNLLEAGNGIETLLGKHYSAFHIVDAQDNQVQLVALLYQVGSLGSRIVCQFGQRNVAGMLGADIDCYFVRCNACNDAGYLLPCICTFEGKIEHFLKAEIISQNVTHGFLYLLNYAGRS